MNKLSMTIAEARAWLRANFAGAGCKCPACGQHVQLKERKITPAMASVLVAIDRQRDIRGEVNISDVKEVRGGDYAKLRYWGLIEKVAEGRWRITQKGIDFVHDRERVPRVAYVYNNRVRRFSDDDVNIRQVLGAVENYDRIVGGA